MKKVVRPWTVRSFHLPLDRTDLLAGTARQVFGVLDRARRYEDIAFAGCVSGPHFDSPAGGSGCGAERPSPL